jgi:hypothetical protein
MLEQREKLRRDGGDSVSCDRRRGRKPRPRLAHGASAVCHENRLAFLQCPLQCMSSPTA